MLINADVHMHPAAAAIQQLNHSQQNYLTAIYSLSRGQLAVSLAVCLLAFTLFGLHGIVMAVAPSSAVR